MNEPVNYILLQSEYTLSYNEEDCFINDKQVLKELKFRRSNPA